jgi:hypothetical protein
MSLTKSTNEAPTAQKQRQNCTTENRKTSGDSNVKTSENTPKSERLNFIKIDMSDIPTEQHCRSEECKHKDTFNNFPKL